jgi:hypothetical protein
MTTETIKIHKGVPMPQNPGRRPRTSKYRIHELKVGEAVHVSKAARSSIIATWKRFAPKKFTSEQDPKDHNMCYVWRIK